MKILLIIGQIVFDVLIGLAIYFCLTFGTLDSQTKVAITLIGMAIFAELYEAKVKK